MRSAELVLLFFLCPSLASVGCANRVLIRSEPMGAQVLDGMQRVGSTPYETKVRSLPFSRPELRLHMPGYRTTTIQLHRDRQPLKRFWEFLTLRWRRAFALVPNITHEVLLIEEHGPAGTWTPEDVPD